jgi:hypothetical protein
MATFIPNNELNGEISDTQVAFGDSDGNIAGSDNFTFADESAGSGPILTVKGDQPYLHLKDDTDATDYMTTLKQSGNSLYLFTDAEPGSAVELARLTPAYMHWNRGEQDVNFIVGSQLEGTNLSLDGATGDFKISRAAGDHVINTDTDSRLTTLRTGVNVINDYTGGNAFLEIRGEGLAFLDLGEPTSTDYTLRLITTSSTTGSVRCLGDLRIQTDANNGDIVMAPNGTGEVIITGSNAGGNRNLLTLQNTSDTAGSDVSLKMVSQAGTDSDLEIIHDSFGDTKFLSNQPTGDTTENMRLKNNGGVIFNNDSHVDGDFRVLTTKNSSAFHINSGTGDITMNGQYGELFKMDSSASAVELYKLILKDAGTGTTSEIYDDGFWFHIKADTAGYLSANGFDVAFLNPNNTTGTNGLTYLNRIVTADLTSGDYTVGGGSVQLSGSLFKVTNAGTYTGVTLSSTNGYMARVYNADASTSITVTPSSGTINNTSSVTVAPKKMLSAMCIGSGASAEWVLI